MSGMNNCSDQPAIDAGVEIGAVGTRRSSACRARRSRQLSTKRQEIGVECHRFFLQSVWFYPINLQDLCVLLSKMGIPLLALRYLEP